MNKYKELYDKIDLKDKDTVKKLLYYRAQFETTGYEGSGSNFNRLDTSQSSYFEILDVYRDLDEIIHMCDFTVKNITLLRLVMSGYSISYIYNNFENYNKEATVKMFNRILERINQAQVEKEAKEDDYKTTKRRREKTW